MGGRCNSYHDCLWVQYGDSPSHPCPIQTVRMSHHKNELCWIRGGITKHLQCMNGTLLSIWHGKLKGWILYHAKNDSVFLIQFQSNANHPSTRGSDKHATRVIVVGSIQDSRGDASRFSKIDQSNWMLQLCGAGRCISTLQGSVVSARKKQIMGRVVQERVQSARMCPKGTKWFVVVVGWMQIPHIDPTVDTTGIEMPVRRGQTKQVAGQCGASFDT
mmetsp:Transcript_31065/g.71594  ORF Transcript_31065/g.71594 Transcript_31065/m.71594 type:complete len:217 (-) Transcript_31065:114-764(-)